jgi:hypothetical protein
VPSFPAAKERRQFLRVANCFSHELGAPSSSRSSAILRADLSTPRLKTSKPAVVALDDGEGARGVPHGVDAHAALRLIVGMIEAQRRKPSMGALSMRSMGIERNGLATFLFSLIAAENRTTCLSVF